MTEETKNSSENDNLDDVFLNETPIVDEPVIDRKRKNKKISFIDLIINNRIILICGLLVFAILVVFFQHSGTNKKEFAQKDLDFATAKENKVVNDDDRNYESGKDIDMLLGDAPKKQGGEETPAVKKALQEIDKIKQEYNNEINKLKDLQDNLALKEKSYKDTIIKLQKERDTAVYDLIGFRNLEKINKSKVINNKNKKIKGKFISKRDFKVNSIYDNLVWIEYANRSFSLQEGDFIANTPIKILKIEPTNNRVKTSIGYIE